MEPGWVAAVRDAIPQADDERVLAAWCGVPLEAVRAVADLLDEEGSAPVVRVLGQRRGVAASPGNGS